MSGAALPIARGLEQTLSPHRRVVDFLVGDLPAGHGAGECRFVGGGSAGVVGQFGERGEDVGGLGPDRNVFQRVVVDDVSFGEAVGGRGRGEAVDAGDDPVAVAETRRDADSGGGWSVAAGVNAALAARGEELIGDQGVHLLYFGEIAGLVGKGGRGREDALGMIQKVGVETDDEVLGSWSGLGVTTCRG